MNKLNPSKVGLTLGSTVGGLHLIWSLLVAFGWGQYWVDFSMKLHMVNTPVVVTNFNAGLTLALIIIAFLIAYFVGFCFAKIWNGIHK